MRCFSRPTASSGSGLATLAQTGVLVVLSVMVGAGESDRALSVEQAIRDAVRAQIGELADVQVVLGHIRLNDGVTGELEARPVAGARLARRTRFTLYRQSTKSTGGAERVGYAVAEAHATVANLRAARPISRGTVLSSEDVVETETDLGAVPLKPLPTIDEVLGSTTTRPLAEGALISSMTIRPPTLVRSGDLVLTRARVGVVVVAGRTTATESGQLGDVIGLVNKQSGRRLKGRVVALGEVEVVY